MPRLSDQGGGGDTFERRLRMYVVHTWINHERFEIDVILTD